MKWLNITVFNGRIIFDEWEEIYDKFFDVYNMNKLTMVYILLLLFSLVYMYVQFKMLLHKVLLYI